MKNRTYTIIQGGKVKKTAKVKDYTLDFAGIKILAKLTGKPAEDFFKGATLDIKRTATTIVDTWTKEGITLISERKTA